MSLGHTLEAPMTLEPGHGAAAGGHGHLRASTADRERAIDVLKAAFAEGRLTKEEHEDRAGRVYSSWTYAELGALTSDLPAGPLGTLPPPPPSAHYGPAYPVMPAGRPVNSLAAASLRYAFVPFIGSAIAIITGVAARKQIRQTGERGSWMAATGIAIGSLTLMLLLLIAVGFL
jgi:hypothetical protein